MNVLPPKLPAHLVKTYAIETVRGVHTRVASCDEIQCPAFAHGWQTRVDEGTDLGRRQAAYIRRDRTRQWRESREAGVTVFVFPSGTTCFTEHHVRNDRPELYVVRGGDFRGNPRGERRIHATPDNWVEDFAEHQQGLAKAAE